MILQKSLKESSLAPTSSATILGLKVVGGKLLSNGLYGAIIEKVKKGSVADIVGHLLPGKRTFAISFDQGKKFWPRKKLNREKLTSGKNFDIGKKIWNTKIKKKLN
jgi:hypothetical protein